MRAGGHGRGGLRAAYTGELCLVMSLTVLPRLTSPSSRPLQVVFLACNKHPDRFAEDGSFTYRCDNLAHALRRVGHRVHLAHYTRWSPRQPADVVVFHRPRMNWRLRWLLWWLRRRGTTVVADVDDLVFRPELASLSPAVSNGVLPQSEIEKQFRQHQQALAQFTLISASTRPLLEELSGQRRQGHTGLIWLPNTVHQRWRDLAENEAWHPPAPPPRLIRYLPGTRSHDRDFALIAPVLQACLRARPAWQLELVGPLSAQLDVPSHQLRRRDKLPFDQYHQVVRGAALNLAPLEDTRFTRCKSAVKVMEAAFWGVPTLCSPIEDAMRLEGAGAVLARTPADWGPMLMRACDDPHWLAAQSAHLRLRMLPHADVEAQAQRWLAALGLVAPPEWHDTVWHDTVMMPMGDEGA